MLRGGSKPSYRYLCFGTKGRPITFHLWFGGGLWTCVASYRCVAPTRSATRRLVLELQRKLPRDSEELALFPPTILVPADALPRWNIHVHD